MKSLQVTGIALCVLIIGGCSGSDQLTDPNSPLDGPDLSNQPFDEPIAEPNLGEPNNPGEQGVVTYHLNDPTQDPNYQEAQVVENCQAVQLAVEIYAAANGGLYPMNLGQVNLAGDTLVDLLPQGQLLANPFHHNHTEPVNGAAAVQGQTGYLVNTNAQGLPTGYLITGFGRHYEIVVIERPSL